MNNSLIKSLKDNYITQSEAKIALGNVRKPRCPFCKTPLSMVSDRAVGLADMKCQKCKCRSIVDLSTMYTRLIVDDTQTINYA